jgi:signal transduction histidine kinase
MGLAISRSMVEGHGGRLRVEPVERGATFALTLPVDRAGEDPP